MPPSVLRVISVHTPTGNCFVDRLAPAILRLELEKRLPGLEFTQVGIPVSSSHSTADQQAVGIHAILQSDGTVCWPTHAAQSPRVALADLCVLAGTSFTEANLSAAW